MISQTSINRKVIWLVLTLALSLCTIVYADPITKQFYPGEQKVTVSNALTGQPTYDTYLKEHVYHCIDCETVYKLCNPGLSSLSMSDLHLRLYEYNRDYIGYSEETYIEVSYVHEEQREIIGTCQEQITVWDDGNKTSHEETVDVECVKGMETVMTNRLRWVKADLSSLEGLPPGECVKIKVTETVPPYRPIDNRVFLHGVEINEFAIWNNTWTFWRDLTITNPHAQNLTEYPCNFSMDISSLLSDDKLEADRSDFRIINPQNKSIGWINTTAFNHTNANIWFRCNVSESDSATYQISYGADVPVNPTYTNRSNIQGLLRDGNTVLLSHFDNATGVINEIDGSFATIEEDTAWNETECLFESKCISFNGVDDQLWWNDSNLLDLTGSYTLEIWVYGLPDAENDAGYGFLSKRLSGGVNRCNYGMNFDIDSDGIGINYQAGSTWVDYKDSTPLAENQWYHATVIYDEDNTDCLTYVNGTLIGVKTDCTNEPTINSAKVRIANFQDSTNPINHEHIIVDEARISNVVRTSNEINHSAHAYFPSFVVGEEQMLGLANIDMFFRNLTNDNTVLVQEEEQFNTYVNHTSAGYPIENSNCTLIFENAVVIEDHYDNNFTLCDSGCEETNPSTWLMHNHETANSTQDQLRMELCHVNAQLHDLNFTYNCTAGTYYKTIEYTAIPPCSSGLERFIVNVSECKDYHHVDFIIDNGATDSTESHQIVSLEHHRKYSSHATETDYDSDYPIFQDTNSDLILSYHLDNNTMYGESDSFVYDFSQSGDNATPQYNARPVSTGYFGGSYYFDGEDDHLLGSIIDNSFDDISFTISAWVWHNETGFTHDKVIVARHVSGAIKNFKVAMNTAGVLEFSTYTACNSGSTDLTNVEVLAQNQWYHVAFVLDNTNIKRIYLNGSEVANSTSVPTIPNSCSAQRTTVGCNLANLDLAWNGYIDEVKIFDRVLTPEEINRLSGNTTTEGLYVSEHPHAYYEHGIKNVSASCVNPNPDFNLDTSALITVQNVQPEIFHTVIEVSDLEDSLNFINGTVIDATNISTVTFYTSISDDDFMSATYLLIGEDNTTYINETGTELFNSVSIHGINLTTQNYTFTTTATDIQNATSEKQTILEIIKGYTYPLIVNLNISPQMPFLDQNLKCSAVAFDHFNTSLVISFDWYLENELQPDYSGNVSTTNNTVTQNPLNVNASGIAYQNWTCKVRAYNGNVYSDYLNSSVWLRQRPEPTGLAGIDVFTLEGTALLFVLIVIWVVLLAFGVFTGNFLFLTTAFLYGIVLGFVLRQVHWIITLFFVLLNVSAFVMMFIGKD